MRSSASCRCKALFLARSCLPLPGAGPNCFTKGAENDTQGGNFATIDQNIA